MPGRFHYKYYSMNRHHTTGILALVLGSALMPAMAAPVSHTFSTGTAAFGASDIISLLGPHAVVTGSFRYDTAAPVYPQSDDPNYAVYFGQSGALAFSGISGSVGGKSFSDIYGSVNVGNDHPVLGDSLTMTSDLPAIDGSSTVLPGPRQLQGFTLGDYALHNVRLFWNSSAEHDNFLASNALPGELPDFAGTLALDFVLTADPTNTAGTPYYSRTVFFQGLTVQAMAVPEPGTGALLLGGLGLVACVVNRQKRR